MLDGKRLEVFSLRLGKRQGCSLSLLLLNIVLEVLAMVITQDKVIKGMQIGKKEVKQSLFVNDITLYYNKDNNCKIVRTTHKKPLLVLIYKFSKVGGYKMKNQYTKIHSFITICWQ